MANEDLIYRITRAVYERLGPGADEQMVDQLVTDLYREVGQSNSTQASAADQTGSSARMIISVFGIAVLSTSTKRWCRESLPW